MYNTIVMTNKLEIFKKRLIYRATYRGTKEMDILLSSFVNKYIDELNEDSLIDIEKFLSYEDEIILNYYHYDLIEKGIDENKISKLFKGYKF